MDTLTTKEIVQKARSIYIEGSYFLRILQHWRPYICPFPTLIRSVPPNSTILDIGCGSGLFLGLLHSCDKISSGLGFDTNLSSINIARKMTKHLPPNHNLEFLHFDATGQWPPGQFDIVSMIDVLHHVPLSRRHAVVEQAISSIKPGGLFLYKDIGHKGWRAFFNRIHDLFLAREWIYYTPIKVLIEWCENNGLTIIKLNRIDMLVYGHEMILFKKTSDR